MIVSRPEPKDSSEGPREINADNVIYWSTHAKELEGSLVTKAQKFVKYDCIDYDKSGKYFVCLPLNVAPSVNYKGFLFQKRPFTKDYNSNVYEIKKENGRWTCSCQGWAKKEQIGPKADGVQCSHSLALLFSFKIKQFNTGRDAKQ